MTNLSKKQLAFLIALIIILGGGGLTWSLSFTKPLIVAQKTVDFQDSATQTRLRYDEKLKTEKITDSDQEDKIILRLTESKGQAPLLVTLRYESGLRVVATTSKASIIDVLMTNSQTALPQRFSGFHKESYRRYQHVGRDAGELIFTYDSPFSEQRIKQRLVILVKDDDTAVYLAMQSTEADFEKHNQQIFDPMAKSLTFE